MKWKIPFLSIAAIIHIIHSISEFQSLKSDSYGFGEMGLRIEIFGGLLAITIDFILMRFIKKDQPFYLTEFFLLLTGASIFYR